MKILIYTPAFLPMIGGLENMAYMLATEWSKDGADVTVITKAHQKNFDDEKVSFTILRNPSHKKYLRSYSDSDLVFFLNISLKGIWPLFLYRKPAYVSHQITYYNFDGSIDLLQQFKRKLSGLFVNISCSNFVRNTLPNKRGVVIPNAYDSDIFTETIPYDLRKKDIVFVGRLVSDKGLDTLIHSLMLIRNTSNKTLSLTVIGDGPELANLKELAINLGISSQISFIGSLTGTMLSQKINEHKIMVVPSKWHEPFGLVALEGLACGCSMVVSKHGGLKEASGKMAHHFENGNVDSLAGAIIAAQNETTSFVEERKMHLLRHTNDYIAKQYLTLFKKNKVLK